MRRSAVYSPRRTFAAAASLLAIAALWALALFFHRPRPPEQAAAESYSDAMYARGDFAAAASTLRAEYRANPSPALKRRLVDALFAANDPAAALAVLRRPDGTPLAQAETIMLRAEALLRLEQPDEAVAEIAPLDVIAPGFADLIRARAAYSNGDAAAADSFLADALRSGGDAAQGAWLLRARFALARNDFAAASAATTRAEEFLAPKASVAALQTEAAIRRGDFAAAHERLGPEQKTPRGETENAYLRTLLDAAEGRYESASIRLRTIEPILSREPRGRLIAAFIREGVGDLAQAEKHYRRAAASFPGDAISQDALAGFLIRQGRYDEAVVAIDRLAEVSPEAAHARTASALAMRGDWDAAFDVLLEGASAAPAPRAAIFGVGAASLDREKEIDQRTHYYSAAASNLLGATRPPPVPDALSKDPLALVLAGEIALRDGDAALAQRRFEAASIIAPEFARAVCGHARARLQTGGIEDARTVVNAVAANRPRQAEILVLVARVQAGGGATQRAMETLRPIKENLLQSRETQTFYADLVVASKNKAALTQLIEAIQQRGEATASSVRLLLSAGRLAEAEATARRALLAGPSKTQDAAVYLEALSEIGESGAENRAMIVALSRRRPEDLALRLASAGLTNGKSLKAVASDLMRPTEDLPSLRSRYLREPESASTTYAFALALLAEGETKRGGALLNEACFWGALNACPRSGLGHQPDVETLANRGG